MLPTIHINKYMLQGFMPFKTIMLKVSITIIGILLLVGFSFEMKGQFAKYSNEFLNIGVDAGSFALGKSVVANTNGVCAGYWNPAGIIRMDNKMETSLMHSNYYSGLAQYDYAGFAYKTNDSLALGLSFIRFGVDDIPNTLDLIDSEGNVNYDRISYFSVADYSLLLSFSKKSKLKSLLWGGSLKLIYRQQGDFANAYGFGFDIGSQYFLDKWKFGAVFRDATSTFNVWIFNKEKFESAFVETGNEIPENSLELTAPKLLLGCARDFVFNKKISLLAELNFDVNFDGEHNSIIAFQPISVDPHLGIELKYLNNIYLRAGVNQLQQVEDFGNSNKLYMQSSIGVGFSLFNLSLDYALTDVGDMSVTPVSHIFSIKYSFGNDL